MERNRNRNRNRNLILRASHRVGCSPETEITHLKNHTAHKGNTHAQEKNKSNPRIKQKHNQKEESKRESTEDTKNQGKPNIRQRSYRDPEAEDNRCQRFRSPSSSTINRDEFEPRWRRIQNIARVRKHHVTCKQTYQNPVPHCRHTESSLMQSPNRHQGAAHARKL